MNVTLSKTISSIDHTLQPEEKYSLILFFAENGIGSILHTFKIPFSGHILSINQIGLMARLSKETNDSKQALKLSINGSLLKSLSPAGKKLTPMLAILAQGILFSFPMRIFGFNFVGLFFGIILSSLWAFVQSLLFLWLIFGKTGIEIFQHISIEIQKNIPNFETNIILVTLIIMTIKVLLSFFYTYYLLRLSDNEFLEKFKKIEPHLNKDHNKHWLKKIEWFYLAALALCVFYFIKLESKEAKDIWFLLRPFAGFILFKILNRTSLFNWLLLKAKSR